MKLFSVLINVFDILAVKLFDVMWLQIYMPEENPFVWTVELLTHL